MTLRRVLVVTSVVLAVALVAGRLVSGAYAEWAWYGALGAGSLWRARCAALVTLRGGLFVAGFIFSFANLLAFRRSIVSLVLPRQVANLHFGEAVPGRALTVAAALVSTLIAGVAAWPQNDWVALLRAWWATRVGESDPFINRDLAFWLGWLPFERSVYDWAVLLTVVVGAVTMLLYALTPSVQFERGRVHVSTWVRRHFAVYTGMLLILVAWGNRLDAYGLLANGSGSRAMYTSFDDHVLIPYLVALGFGTAAIGCIVAWLGWIGSQRAMFVALLAAVVAGPIGRAVLPLLDRGDTSARARASAEQAYHHSRLLYTRRAFRVDDILRGSQADSVRIDSREIARRVSAWDPAALVRASSGGTANLPASAAQAWLVTRGDSLRVIVARSAESGSAGSARATFDQFAPADADDRGAPWPAQLAPAAALPLINVGNDIAATRVIGDTLDRVLAPRFGSAWQRIFLAWSVRKLPLAVSDEDPRFAKLLLRRDVHERVRAIAPFFWAGATVQGFIAGDSLWWQVELFHAGDAHPLTEPIDVGGASLRSASLAAVALVNAHSGRVMLVVPRRPDQMTRWWRDHLPELFTPRSALIADLLRALPPLVDLAQIQGAALARVGFRNDTLAARLLSQSAAVDAELLSGAPTPFASGATNSPLAWGVPIVDAIDRVRGVLVAVGGRDPRTVFVESPDTVRWTNMLDQLQRAADSTLVGMPVRHPLRGRIQVVPTVTGWAAVRSLYDWTPDRPPALAGTVVWQREEVRVGESLAAIAARRGLGAGDGSRLRVRIARLYDAMQNALRRGDWSAFGQAMAELRRLSGAR